MNFTVNIGKALILFGAVLIIVGLVFLISAKIIPDGWRLPGDIHFKKGNFVFYFPLTTSIVISLLISIILRIIKK